MTLKTERLTLRPPIDQDVDAYYDICNSEFVLQYNAMTKKSKEDILSAFKRSREADDMLLLELIDCKRVIGAVFIESDSIRWDVNSKELSYFLGEQYSRKGYMKEALSEVIHSDFKTGRTSVLPVLTVQRRNRLWPCLKRKPRSRRRRST